jgi:hypothetical protein
MRKSAFSRNKTLFTRSLDLDLRKKIQKCNISSTGMNGFENCTLRKVDQKGLESFDRWYWRRIETISLTDYVRNEEVLHRAKEERSILHIIKKKKIYLDSSRLV